MRMHKGIRVFTLGIVLVSSGVCMAGSEPSMRGERPVIDATKARLVIQSGHGKYGAPSAVFSPDGRFVLTTDLNGSILWDGTTGRQLRRFTGHTGFVRSNAFSPDGLRLLTWRDNIVQLWDTATGQELHRFDTHREIVTSAIFSPNGHWVLVGGDQSARLWEATTGQELHAFGHSGFANAMAFSPDGRWVLTSGAHIVWLEDAVTGRQLRQFATHVRDVRSAAFSRDGRWILTTSDDRTARLFDVATGKELRVFGGDTRILTAALSPDRRFILTARENDPVYLWDAATGREVRRFAGNTEHVTSAMFSPDGRTILTTGQDDPVRLWDVGTGRELRSLANLTYIAASAMFSPDSRFILTTTDRVALWDAATGQELRRFEGLSEIVTSATASPNGRLLITAGETKMVLWDMATGLEVRRFGDGRGSENPAVFSHDSRFVLSSGQGEDMDDISIERPAASVRLWDVITGRELRQFSAGERAVHSAAFSPDSRRVVTAPYHDYGAYLWDVKTGQRLQRLGHDGEVISAVFSPKDGHFVLTASEDQTVRLWDTENGRELQRFTGHTERVTSAVFSPEDDNSILTASDDQTVRQWDTTTGKEQGRFEGHPGASSVMFSPDGRSVLTSGKGMCLWDAKTRNQRWCISGPAGTVTSSVFSPDGRFILTTHWNETVRLWDVDSGKERARFVSFSDGTSVVVSPDGHYDPNNVEQLKGMHWVMPDDPFRALPLDIFMRDYYEPRLLSRVLAGEKLPEIRSLTALTRVQPKVQIMSIERESGAGGPGNTVTITTEVSAVWEEFGHNDTKWCMGSGVYDLRLFRNGQLVGQFPDPQDEPLSGEQTHDQVLVQWRKQHAITLDPKTGKKTITFRGIRLPRTVGLQNVEFSAYAFNVDRVKSTTARSTLPIPKELTPRQGRAYVVTIGANRFAGNRMPSLSFAVNDAKVLNEELSRRLKAMHDPASGKLLFGEANVVPISLITDAIDNDRSKSRHTNHATKGRIKAVIDKLAGKPVDLAQLEGIANTDQLQLAQPEDLVLITFSTHGDTDGNKQFYLMPSDLGESSDQNDLWRHAISSEELSAWLRPVDAGELVMIVDACRSAATVKNQEFKPGPMGSRGLGQLAFDKGMRILAASQLDQEAKEGLENELGLLTSALVVHGLQNHRADFKPPDGKIQLAEWLQYSVEQVPKLYTEFHSKDPQGVIPSATRMGTPLDKPKGNVESIQTPELFDFARGRDLPLVIGTQ